MNLNVSLPQWIGVGGIIVSFVGMFAPLYSALTIHVNLVSIWWPIPATFGVALAVAAATIVRRHGKLTLGAGLVALGVVLGVFVRYQTVRAGIDDEITSDPSGIEWADDFAARLGEMAQASLSPQWGWAVLIVGVAAILFASVALIRAGRMDSSTQSMRQIFRGMGTRKRWLLASIAAAVVGVTALGTVTFTTSRHWSKVDKPAYSEEYETGSVVVTDDHISPCHIGQDWNECTNLHVDEYNNACLDELSSDSQDLCEEYGNEIDRRQFQIWDYVTSLGSFGHLESEPETLSREVPAETHPAVCYLGFIGECE